MDYKKSFRWFRLLGIATLALSAFQTQAQTFGVYRQLWTGLSTTDASVNALTNTVLNPNWPNNPNPAYTQVFTNFETETNLMDGYGQRVRGFVVPPTTGPYTFWIASRGASSLFVNNADETATRTLRCWVANGTNPREWTRETNQMSAPITLEGGRRYYIEAIHKVASGGGDNLAVRWQLPNGAIEEPLAATSAAGTLLVPFNGATNAIPGIYTQPTNTTAVEASTPIFSVVVTNWGPVNYQWQKGGTNITSGLPLKSIYAVNNVTVAANNGQSYDCVVSNASGSVTSVVATLTVITDTFPPTLASARSAGPNIIAVGYSKTVELASATNSINYALDGGLAVTAASLADAQTVWLTVSPSVTYGSNYTLTVNNVRDRAATPNSIAPNSQISFTAVAYGTLAAVGGAFSGSFTTLTNGYDISGAGSDIGGTNDQFQFSSQLLSGNFDVSARVQGLSAGDTWAKAALVARESLDPGSRFAGAIATPGSVGEFFEYRVNPSTLPTSAGSFPPNYPFTWLRLSRATNLFSAYASYDGQTWSLLGSATLTLSNTLYCGMAVSSHSLRPVLAQFRNIGPTSGSAMVGTQLNPSEPLGACSRRTPFVISEIMNRPAPRLDGNDVHYVEIYNSNPFFENLSGYSLSGDIQYTFPSNTILQGNSFIVVAASPASIQAVYGITNVVGPFTGSLKKSGSLQMNGLYGAIHLEISYSDSAPWLAGAAGTGHSLVLARPTYGEADPRAWGISDVMGGSPGGQEAFRPSPLRNVVINEILAHAATNQVNFLELYNHSTSSVDVSGCILTDGTTNKFVIPPSTVLPAGGFQAFYETNLPFFLNPAGETVFFINPDHSRVLDAAAFEAQALGVSVGRWPDGAGDWYPMSAQTPGAANAAILIGDIVINELMYDPISGSDDDQYVELYNKGASTINLGGWAFTSGITFTFPANTLLAPDGYLVVARNVTNLLAHYPNLTAANTMGNYTGRLSHKGERVALAMPDGAVEDEVSFGVGGRWGDWAKGGGSSLELLNPNSNHRLAYNWGDSDESLKSSWTNLQVTGLMDNGQGNIDLVQMGLLDVGECLIDKVELRAGVNGPNLIINGDFEAGSTGWTPIGDHMRSSLETATGLGGYQSGNSMHVRSSDGVYTGANSVQCTKLVTNLASSGMATLKMTARWLRGAPFPYLRVHGNWIELNGTLPVPLNLGTPGQKNSRAVTSAGPAIYEVKHSPPLPPASQPVVVTARFHDVNGVTPTLLYRVDTAVNLNPTYISVPMNDGGTNGDAIAGDGIYSARIPAQAAGVVVAFVIQAQNGLGKRTIFPADRRDNAGVPRECVVMFGDTVPVTSFRHQHAYLTQNWIKHWSDGGGLSNENSDGTMVEGGGRIIYNWTGRYAGSPYHQYTGSPVGTVSGEHTTFPEDEMFLGSTSGNKQHLPGNGPLDDNTIQREQACYWMARQIGVEFQNRRYYVYYVNGNRHGPLMEDTQVPSGDEQAEYFPNGGSGLLYKAVAWFDDSSFANTNISGGLGTPNLGWCTLNKYTTTIDGIPNQHKLARYRWTYWVRSYFDSPNDYTNVFSLIDAANTPTSSPAYYQNMETLVDTERWMQMGALEHVSGDWDSVFTQNQWNMYYFKPVMGKWTILKWDWNIALGGGTSTWGPDGGNLFNFAVDAQMAKIFNHPAYARAYLRAFKEIAAVAMNNSFIDPVLDAKFASFAANGLNTANFGITVSDPGSLKSWINTCRNSILAALISHGVSNVAFAVTGPASLNSGTNLVTLTGTAPVEIKTITINGTSYPLIWTTTTNWSVQVPVGTGTNRLSVQGYDRQGHPAGTLSNAVSVVFTNTPPSPVGSVVINEIMFNPLAPNGQYVELFNTSSTFTFDLSGWSISGLNYSFPTGSFIRPLSYLVLAQDAPSFLEAYGNTIPIFDQFTTSLSSTGQTLSLIAPGPTPDAPLVVDQVRYEALPPWPTGSNGVATASSIEVLDPLQDNSRPGNWATTYIPAAYTPGTNLPLITHPAVTNNPGWHFASATTTSLAGATNLLLLFIEAAGKLYIDDLALVDGTNAGVGFNFISQGDFEVAALDPNLWVFSTNYTNSVLSSDVAHSGTNSLLIISTQNTPGGSYLPLRGFEQIMSSAPTNGETCTLSFWYYATSQATNFDARLSASLRIITNVSLNITPSYTEGGYYQPAQLLSPPLVVATPGRANSAQVSLPPFPPLWLNEVQADNLSGITNSAGQHAPWVELYNAGTNSVSLNGLYLANSYSNLTAWAFPAGATINPGQFKVIFCDGQSGLSTLTELHTSFQLTSHSGSVALSRLFNGQPQVLDFLDYSGLTPGLSYGDFPDGQPFTRQQFFYVTPGGTNNATTGPLQVFVNEWMSANLSTIADPADNNAFDDWFELYNAGPTPANLDGYYLANNTTNKFLFQIPPGYVIPSGGFLLVWADKKAGVASPDLHTNFRLPKGGATIGLYTPVGATVDAITYAAQSSDVATGRCPDGGPGIGVRPVATPRGPNSCNNPPVLQPIADRAVYLGQTLNLTAVASDPDPGQGLVYSLIAGAPFGTTIDPATGFFQWTPTAAEAPSTNQITVRVSDNGVPSLSDSKSFKVTVALPPKATIGRPAGGSISLTFPTLAGKNYKLQYKDDFHPSVPWTDLPNSLTAGTGGNVTISDNLASNPDHTRFYRIVPVN